MDIPGYRIVKPLGRGGMATVYLAIQESVQREVALKVMSSTLLGDEEFGLRFLREARIAARLRHPNVVQVHDVGIAGEHHYIAMEYLPGGAVIGRAGASHGVAFALQVTRQIADALDYAGRRGIVHRDIKPDNILMREGGSAVLTDFGIAHASDVTRMTRTGAIVGTPHYMSPEQARGLPLDGRADLYSLGIVLHELLVGSVPYQAPDSLAVGIMHITAPLPRLPSELSALQPVLDRMLAKEPERRFQSGADVVAAIDALRREHAEESLAATRVMPAIPPPPPVPGSGGDAEPQLGRIDEVLRTPDRPRASSSLPTLAAARGRFPMRLAWLGLLLVLLGGGYLFQDRLRGFLPQTRMSALLQQADHALREGRLSESQGRGARELYLAALAQDPDNLAAREGVAEVGRRLLQGAHEALEQGDDAPARTLLSQAATLGLPAGEIQSLQARLDASAQAGSALADVIQQARDAALAGRWDGGEDSAVALYRRALVTDPGNAIATAGLRDVLAVLLDQARSAMARGELDTAAASIERVAAIDPAHLGLPDARAALAAARQADANAVEEALAKAGELLARGHLMAPQQPNAAAAYRAILAAQPSQPEALRGLRRVAQALLVRAGKQIDDHQFDAAQSCLDEAQALVPGMEGLAAVAKRLDDVRQRVALRSDAMHGPAFGDLAGMLQRARTAAEAGQFLVPPGESAYDLYRAVLAQAPGNAEARAGLAALPDRAIYRFDEAMAANRLGAARAALSALFEMAPSDARLMPARQRLARSYLAYASERLGAGELDLAGRAIDQARELDSTSIELPALQARLEQAKGRH